MPEAVTAQHMFGRKLLIKSLVDADIGKPHKSFVVEARRLLLRPDRFTISEDTTMIYHRGACSQIRCRAGVVGIGGRLASVCSQCSFLAPAFIEKPRAVR